VRARRRPSFDMLSVSALDLFASSLGVFMLLAVMLFPYYLKKPALERQIDAGEAALAQATANLDQATASETAATTRRAAAEDALAKAKERQAAAVVAASEAAAARARLEAAAAAEAAAAPPVPTPSPPSPLPPPPNAKKPGIAIAALDLVLVMDTTGSMRDELEDVQASLLGTIRVLSKLTGSLRVGFVAYRDRGEAYVVRTFPLRSVTGNQADDIVRFVRDIRTGGGGDDPEAVDEALAAAVAMPWRSDAAGRIILIGDARAHPNAVARAVALAAQFHASSPSPAATRTVTAVFSGNAPVDRAFFRQVAMAGGGSFAENKGRVLESVMLAVLGERKGTYP